MHFTEPFEQLKVKYNLNTSLSLANTFDRASLTFVNSDFAVEYPVPLSPDTVLIGGLFFDEPRDFDPELAAFIQGSGEAGVVVVSMGTLVGHYSARWTQLFLAAFARLSQRVIWRYAGRPTIDLASSGSDVPRSV
jgi:glucuronosyltransferase